MWAGKQRYCYHQRLSVRPCGDMSHSHTYIPCIAFTYKS
jgi:hypothetical protein